MKLLSHKQLEREEELRKIVKSLSRLSMVDTREIRKEITKASSSKNAHRAKYYVESDQLLKEKKTRSVTNFALSRLKEEDRKAGSIKDKKIESEAALKMVNFEYHKLQSKKQRIAKKYRQFIIRCRAYPPILVPEPPVIDAKDLKENGPQDVFGEQNLAKDYDNDDVDEEFLKRIREKVTISKVHMNQLYEGHCRSIKYLSVSAKKARTQRSIDNPDIQTTKFNQDQESPDKKDQINTAHASTVVSFISSPARKKQKRRSLLDLIRLSTSRIKYRQQMDDQKMTRKERVEYSALDHTLGYLKKAIDKDNRQKESIVFTGLKKILYGDRKGRFIQDNAFKTRLTGQNSDQYLKILREQGKIFDSFQGSYFNRRNLAEKLSDILGTLNKTARSSPKRIIYY